MNVIRCFLCVISFFNCVEFIYIFNIGLLRGRQIGFRIYSNLHGLIWGHVLVLFSPYQHTNMERGYYNALSFSSFLSVFSQGIFSDLMTPSFFPVISLHNNYYWPPVFNYKSVKWIRYNWVPSVSMNKKQSKSIY